MAESLQKDAKRMGMLIHKFIQEIPIAMQYREAGLWEAYADEAKQHPYIIENFLAAAEQQFREALDLERVLEKPCNCAYQLAEDNNQDKEDWDI